MEAAGSRLVSHLIEMDKTIDATRQAATFCVDPAELGEAVCELARLSTKIESLLGELTHSAYVNGATVESEQRTMAQYVGARTNVDPARIRRAQRLNDWLMNFPIFAEAYATGDLTAEHLHLLRLKIDNERTHDHLVADQQFFVDYGPQLEFKEFVDAAEYWLVRVDVEGKEPVDQQDSTGLHIFKGSGGRLILKGELDVTSGQAFQKAIDDEAEKIRQTDLAEGVERNTAQRRAQALSNLVTRGAARPDGSYPAPLINIVMSHKVWEWLITNTGDDTEIPVHWNDVDRRCELIDGTPIHPAQALKLFGIAVFRRHIIDAKSRILDTSHNARAFPEWMRNALLVQSRGRCETHGCDNPHHWLQIDHIEPDSRGGPTSWANAQPLCRPDNHAKTDTTGHTPWRNKPPPPRHQPPRQKHCEDDQDDDPH